MKYLLLTLLLILVPLQLSLLYDNKSPDGSVAGISNTSYFDNKQSKNVNVSAFIGDHRFNLYGYTSPRAFVTFDGQGIFDTTTADDKGYFEFNNRFSPLSSREACLTSKDQFGRLSSPVCLPPFPIKYDVNIGPVIMPPTVSLNNPSVGSDYFTGDQIMLSGQAVPNTEIKLSVFGDNKNKFEARGTKIETNLNFKIRILKIISDFELKTSNFAFITPVEAFTFPELTAKSDSKGNFSVNLPSSNPENFRLFAQTDFNKSISPNSIKLNLDILPIWMIIIKFFLFLFFLIKPRLLEILILSEIIYILYILKGHVQSKAIILKERFPLIESGFVQIVLSKPNA